MKILADRIVLWFFFLMVFVPAWANASPKNAIMDYTSATEAQLAWINKNFSLKIAGKNPNNPDMLWMGYYDIHGPGRLSEARDLKDWALDNKLNSEEILIHAKNNYTSTLGAASWVGLDKFDAFELDPLDNSKAKNGVLLETSPGIFTDKTEIAYNGTFPYTAVNSNFYLGYSEPFDKANFIFSAAAAGLSGTWQYWNGTKWDSLVIADGTSSMSVNGSITFTPPSDWTVTSINGSLRKYFIRFLFISATKAPIVKMVKGDDWRRYGGTNPLKDCHGWDSTSATIINAGTPLAYNPTPPTTATAKFPYQARIAYWSSNRFIANPADKQQVKGVIKRTWSEFVAYTTNQQIKQNGWTGLMGDDGETNGIFNGISYSNTDFVDKTTNTWLIENISRYEDIVNAFYAINPIAKFGLNGQGKTLVMKGGWSLAEYHTFVYKTANPRGITVGDGATKYMCYDDYLPENNPNGIFGLLIYEDTVDKLPVRNPWTKSTTYVINSKIKVTVNSVEHSFICTQAGTSGAIDPVWTFEGNPILDGTAKWVYQGGIVAWDRSNRGPLLALSKHLIASNVNTYFSYYTRGGYVYSESDDVILNDNTVVHLATQPVPPLATVKRWGTWFPAMSVDFGVPDITGWNSGIRSFTWKLGADIGGGSDVWRRDYTNAVVLHRPSTGDTTGPQLSTPSISIDLGGTFYPLYADGTIGGEITSIALRNGEGAILMRSPILPSQTTYPDTTVPTPSISSPVNGTIVSGKVAVTIASNDNVGVTKVELYVNNLLQSADLSPNASNFAWDTSSVVNGSYILSAKAYDAAGNVGQSANVSVTVNNPVPDIAAPTVTAFSMPAAATSLTVVINGFTASDNVGVTGYLVAEGSVPPSLDAAGWTTSAPTSFTFSGYGSKTAYAWAKDAAGNLSNGLGRSVVITQSDLIVPTASITSPLVGAVMRGITTVNVVAADNAAVSKVELYINGKLFDTKIAAPYSFTWNTTTLANGSYTLSAKAYDAAGNIGQSVPVTVMVNNADITLPTAALTSPVSGGVVAGTATVNATAGDNVGVAKVEFYVNGTLRSTDTAAPYNFAWNTATFANGSYTLSAKAYDAAGNVGQSASVTVTVNNIVKDTIAPVVSAFSSINVRFSPGVVLTATATDNVGVVKMTVTANGRQIASANAAKISWTFKDLAPGKYTVVIRAYDAAGNVGSKTATVWR